MPKNRAVIISVSLSTLLTTLAVSSVNILLPSLIIAFDTSFSIVQWVTISYMIFMSSTLFIAGRLSDVIGRRKIFLYGIVVFVAASSLASISSTIWWLITSRALQGVGSGMVIATGMAVVADIASKSKLGAGMGLLASMSAVGTALGPLIGGYLEDSLSWRIMFLFNIPVGLTVFYLARKSFYQLDIIPKATSDFRPDKRSDLRNKAFNYKGATALFLTIVAYTLLVQNLAEPFSYTNALLLFLILVLLRFVVSSQSAPQNSSQSSSQQFTGKPFIDLRSLNNSSLVISLLSNTLVPAMVMTTMVTGPFYLVYGLGQTISNAGLIMSIGSIIVAISAPFVGKMVGRLSPRFFITLGLFEIAIGALLMSSLEISSGIPGYLLATSVMAMGYATFTTSNNTLIMHSPTATERGAISGLISLSKNIGLLSGATLITMYFNYSLDGRSVSTADISDIQLAINNTYQMTFFIAVVALLINCLPTVKAALQKLNPKKLS